MVQHGEVAARLHHQSHPLAVIGVGVATTRPTTIRHPHKRIHQGRIDGGQRKITTGANYSIKQLLQPVLAEDAVGTEGGEQLRGKIWKAAR